MKPNRPIIAVALLLLTTVFLVRLFAAETKGSSGYEYATVRWAGKENTHVIRPGGQVEFIGSELQKAVKPDRADARSFYLNLAMNGLTKEGWEFAGISNDDIVMRRAVAR